jgi:hypothetical protein
LRLDDNGWIDGSERIEGAPVSSPEQTDVTVAPCEAIFPDPSEKLLILKRFSRASPSGDHKEVSG